MILDPFRSTSLAVSVAYHCFFPSVGDLGGGGGEVLSRDYLLNGETNSCYHRRPKFSSCERLEIIF